MIPDDEYSAYIFKREAQDMESRMLDITKLIYHGYTEPEIKGSLDHKMIELHRLLHEYTSLAMRKEQLIGKIDELYDRK